MRTLPAVSLALLFAVTACAAGEPQMADMEDPGGDSADGEDPLADMLKAKYGVRPRRYVGLLNQSNEAEKRFVGMMPMVTAFLNDLASRHSTPFSMHEAELMVNFITEGGFFVLDGDQIDGIDGFGSLGIDTLVDNYAALKPWLHQSIRDAIENGDRVVENINELGQKVKSLTDLTIEEGMWANAGMFAWSRATLAADLASRGTPLASLPQEGQFFWTTVYFNAGPGTGRKMLDKNGVRFFEKKWLKADDANQFSQSAQFNALWRTASFEYLLKAAFPSKGA